MSQKRPRSPSPQFTGSLSPSSAHQFFLSSPITDRSSTFIGLYSPTGSVKDLQARSDFKTASHRIAAWRKPSNQRTLAGAQCLLECGHDDDGEQYAGKKLERVLENLNVQGAVIVARWYGGVLLGPVRFAHIENCAKEAIGKGRANASAGDREIHTDRKRKIDEDEEKSGLVRTLGERDHSIIVLRDLLREKAQATSTKSLGENTASNIEKSTPTKKSDYSIMPLQVLKRLDKARDATLAWILKELDKVEQQENPNNNPG